MHSIMQSHAHASLMHHASHPLETGAPPHSIDLIEEVIESLDVFNQWIHDTCWSASHTPHYFLYWWCTSMLCITTQRPSWDTPLSLTVPIIEGSPSHKSFTRIQMHLTLCCRSSLCLWKPSHYWSNTLTCRLVPSCSALRCLISLLSTILLCHLSFFYVVRHPTHRSTCRATN